MAKVPPRVLRTVAAWAVAGTHLELTYLLPVIAIVLGVLVLREQVTALTLAGMALVLAGVALTRRRATASAP